MSNAISYTGQADQERIESKRGVRQWSREEGEYLKYMFLQFSSQESVASVLW